MEGLEPNRRPFGSESIGGDALGLDNDDDENDGDDVHGHHHGNAKQLQRHTGAPVLNTEPDPIMYTSEQAIWPAAPVMHILMGADSLQ